MSEKIMTTQEPKNDSSFTMQIGNTTFVVGLHFSKTCKETLEDKMKRLIEKDVSADNF